MTGDRSPSPAASQVFPGKHLPQPDSRALPAYLPSSEALGRVAPGRRPVGTRVRRVSGMSGRLGRMVRSLLPGVRLFLRRT
ncbi:hypothetical protein OHA21_22065 [Actinoplanes sp. NBC_00393]|uniref:hypothetical protein n=1 Tax=Actinoplanes sp. NBC_00393 TaxID=2975953 RepID=UPI002E22B8E0